MGNCFTSGGEDNTVPPPPEEKVISRYTTTFGFQRRVAKDCIACLLSNSTNGKLTEEQFNTVVVALNLSIVELDNIDGKHYKFFKQFKEKQLYNVVKLCCLALLLTPGSLKDKVAPMFDAIPGQVEGEVDSTNLQLFWKTMVTIAAEALPFLAIDENPIPGQSLSSEACRGYVNILEKGEDQLVSELVQGVLFGLPRIRKDDFASRVSTMPLFQVLASPDRIRGVLYTREAPKPKPKK